MKIQTTNKNYIYKKANFPKKQEKKPVVITTTREC